MNNHSYAIIAVEPEHLCVVDLHTGKYMTDAIYRDVKTYKNGFVMQRIDGKYDIFDSNCKTIIDKVDKQTSYGSRLIKVRKNDMVNVLNMSTGKLIIPKWIPARAQMQIVTPGDSNGTFKHQKPGIYIAQQKSMNLVILLQFNKFTLTLMVKHKYLKKIHSKIDKLLNSYSKAGCTKPAFIVYKYNC